MTVIVCIQSLKIYNQRKQTAFFQMLLPPYDFCILMETDASKFPFGGDWDGCALLKCKANY